jgi:hypothetical protein
MSRISNLAPGGWAEISDYDVYFTAYDDSLSKAPNLMKWINDILKSCHSMGVDPCPGPKLKERAIAAGFVDVVEEVYDLPIGGWPLDKKLVSSRCRF